MFTVPGGRSLYTQAPMETRKIVVLEGDDTGQELLEEALRVLAPDVVGIELELPRFDLSLESRRATRNPSSSRPPGPCATHGWG